MVQQIDRLQHHAFLCNFAIRRSQSGYIRNVRTQGEDVYAIINQILKEG